MTLGNGPRSRPRPLKIDQGEAALGIVDPDQVHRRLLERELERRTNVCAPQMPPDRGSVRLAQDGVGALATVMAASNSSHHSLVYSRPTPAAQPRRPDPQVVPPLFHGDLFRGFCV